MLRAAESQSGDDPKRSQSDLETSTQNHSSPNTSQNDHGYSTQSYQGGASDLQQNEAQEDHDFVGDSKPVATTNNQLKDYVLSKDRAINKASTRFA